MPGPVESPRDRYRAHNRGEIKRIALKHLAAVGPAALTLTSIAKDMGFSGPALYRYFANREELLAELAAEAYRDAADTVAVAAARAAGLPPRRRLHTLAGAYRRWALAQPHRYLLLATPHPAGPPPPTHLAADRQILDALIAVLRPALAPADASRAAVAVWVHLHGLLTLEVRGHLDGLGLDPAATLAADIDMLADTAGLPAA